MDPHRTPTARHLRLLAVAAIVLAPLFAVLDPAAAHEDAGEMTVTAVEQTGPSTVHLEVGIVYLGDGHLAEDATVSAVLTGTDGSMVGPVTLGRVSDTSSLYAADVEVGGPGTWAVAVTSAEPTASATASVDVVAAATPAESTTSTLLDEEGDQIFTANTAADGSVEDGGAVDEYIDQAAEDSQDGSSSSSTLFVVLAVVAVVLIGGGGLFVYLRRNAPGALSDEAEDPTHPSTD